MVTPRVTKALNPHRRKLSLAQIRAGFGGKRRKASIKAKRHTHKRRAKAANPKKRKRRASAKRRNPRTRVVYRTKYKTRTRTKIVRVKSKPRRKANAKRRRRSNPGPYLLTMSPVGNPHRKRRKSVAKHRRRASAKGRSGKRRNPTRRRRHVTHRRHHARNPMGVSQSTVRGVVGAAVGFSICKKVPPMFGTGMNSSPMMSLLSTGITAAVVAWAAKRFAPGFAEGALIGGGMAVLNVAWNAWRRPRSPGIPLWAISWREDSRYRKGRFGIPWRCRRKPPRAHRWTSAHLVRPLRGPGNKQRKQGRERITPVRRPLPLQTRGEIQRCQQAEQELTAIPFKRTP